MSDFGSADCRRCPAHLFVLPGASDALALLRAVSLGAPKRSRGAARTIAPPEGAARRGELPHFSLPLLCWTRVSERGPLERNARRGAGAARRVRSRWPLSARLSVRRSALIALLRPEQWIKNLLVGAPLFLTPAALGAETVIAALLGIAGFSALSSAGYIVNDYVDRASDRRHPVKRGRPLAAGTIAPLTAFLLFALLAAGGLALAIWLSPAFAAYAGGYLALSLVYSVLLKRIAIVDVMAIAVGFVLRVEAGAQLIVITPSAWIIIATGLLALFLALGKRRDDLVHSLDGDHRRSLAGYTKPFLDTAVAVVLGAILIGYLVYTTDSDVMARLGTTKLFYTAPFVVAGILRYLQIMLVEERSDSPTRILLTDRFIALTVVGWLATFGALIYG